ncbi:MAG: alpha/beta fold hydrolase [Thermoguttaceae bacterium]|nr:alpha/beta fold hydrolase [Thermoguttaceae bacterium]MDW8039702.1 alpha/beta fold hydrolase [Thermoguttaceae bacterium]
MKATFGKKRFLVWRNTFLAIVFLVAGQEGSLVLRVVSSWRWGLALAQQTTKEKGASKSTVSQDATAERLTPKKDHKNLLIYWDEQGRELPVRTVQDWQRRRADILRGFQETAGPLPEKFRQTPLDVQILKTEETPVYRRIKLSYQPEPGDRVPAWLLIPKQLRGRTAAMLCLHQTISIGKDEPVGLGGSASLHYAHELALLGFVCLAPDYPSFGEYPYNFRTQGAHYASGTMKAIWNNIRAVDLLETRPEVDPKRIGCIGHSLGGHNAIYTAVFEPRLKVIVSSCGFTPFHDYYGGRLDGYVQDRYMPLIGRRFGKDPDRVPWDYYELIGALAPRPFLTNSPLHDANFDVGGVKKVIVEAKKIYQLYGVPEHLIAFHPDCGHDFPEPVRKEIYAFLSRYFDVNPANAIPEPSKK